MNKKQIIKITESDLHRMVSEAVKAVLKEDYEAPGFEDDDEIEDMDDDNFRRALDSTSKRYLHRKGSLSREV